MPEFKSRDEYEKWKAERVEQLKKDPSLKKRL